MHLLEYTHNETTLEAYVANGRGGADEKPAIIIFHAWKGREKFVCEKAEYFAKLGYVGIALDMYGKGVLGNNNEENAQLMKPFIDDRTFLLERMKRGYETVQKLDHVDPEKIVVVGFCFGGLCALDLARSVPDLAGAVSIHGNLIPPPRKALTQISTPILVFHGHEDPLVPPEQVTQFMHEMTEAKADWQFHTFSKTLHAYTHPEANDPEMGLQFNALSNERTFEILERFLHERFTTKAHHHK